MNKSLHINTPLLRSSVLSSPSQDVWLKLEAMQPSGSFKNRGVGVACQHYVAQGARRLISSSGGNAGIATAYCGSQLGVAVHVVVPQNAPQTAINAIQRFGAEVEIHGSTWQEAHQRALSYLDENSCLIHPFDDPLLWPGHATMIDEVVEAGVIPDSVILSVGGGGLLCGVAAGLNKHQLGEVEIVAVETHGAASLHAAIAAGHPVMLDEITTIANTLGAKQVCQAAFDVTEQHSVISHLVSDGQALEASQKFLEDHRILVEPACGATLAAVYDKMPSLQDKKNILVVVCGGMGVSTEQIKNWQQQLESA